MSYELPSDLESIIVLNAFFNEIKVFDDKAIFNCLKYCMIDFIYFQDCLSCQYSVLQDLFTLMLFLVCILLLWTAIQVSKFDLYSTPIISPDEVNS